MFTVARNTKSFDKTIKKDIQIQRKMAMRQKLVNNIFIDTQSACKGTSTKSQKQFPKTRFTFLCIQN